jgi:hypothetical protein
MAFERSTALFEMEFSRQTYKYQMLEKAGIDTATVFYFSGLLEEFPVKCRTVC